MARRTSTGSDDHLTVERTRTSAAYVGIALAVLFLVLLIVFIAQNNRPVELKFLGADGKVSEALAIVVAALAGAVVVLLIGTARILQLRLNTRRHNKAAKRQTAAAATAAESTTPAPGAGTLTEPGSGEPLPPASPREAQPVQPQR